MVFQLEESPNQFVVWDFFDKDIISSNTSLDFLLLKILGKVQQKIYLDIEGLLEENQMKRKER